MSKHSTPVPVSKLGIKIFADGADFETMIGLYADPTIAGFTTNPTLMRKAGIGDYPQFAKRVAQAIPDRPISFEVFSDDLDEMVEQGRIIASWGPHVYVKVPVTTTSGVATAPVVRALATAGAHLNVTAIMTLEQVHAAADWLRGSAPSFISVFAGRIADTGRDPVPLVRQAVSDLRAFPQIELIWASPRELLNIYHAASVGCHVITVTADMLAKLPQIGRDLDEFSLDTVRMFHRDGLAAGFDLRPAPEPVLAKAAKAFSL